MATTGWLIRVSGWGGIDPDHSVVPTCEIEGDDAPTAAEIDDCLSVDLFSNEYKVGVVSQARTSSPRHRSAPGADRLIRE
jgi:hypothetical protein